MSLTPIPPKETSAALDQLDQVLRKAASHASGRDIDDQQVAIARLADVATKLRAARDLGETRLRPPARRRTSPG